MPGEKIVKRVAQASLFRMMVGSMEADPAKTLELFPWLPDICEVGRDEQDLAWRTVQKLKEFISE